MELFHTLIYSKKNLLLLICSSFTFKDYAAPVKMTGQYPDEWRVIRFSG